MAFLKKYNGTRDPALLRLERTIWVLIYGGLLSLVLGYFVVRQGSPAPWLLGVGGAALVMGLLGFLRRVRMADGR